MNRALVTLLLLMFPGVSFASVMISEVAWMGTEVSANDEWIELHNTGMEVVAVDGWVLSDGGSLVIPLAGAVGAGQYVLLERTNDDSAPGTAHQIYKGSLTNSGVTLVLKNAQSEVMDEVVGGVNWSLLGGSNKQKTTPQRTETGWITAPATPGAAPPKQELISELVTTTEPPPKEASTPVKPNEQEAAVVTQAENISLNWWYLATVIFLAISIFALYGTRRNQ